MTWIETLRALLGPDKILTDKDVIGEHSYDWWPVAQKWRQQGKQPYRPDAVVRPRSAEEISQVLRWASENGIPVTPRGAGSSVTGAAVPVKGGISLDLSAMNRILALNQTDLYVRAQAGVIGRDLEQHVNQRGFTLNHSPQSLVRSTVGGWVSTRASGQFSSRWGSIEDLVLAYTVVLPTGEVVTTPLVPRAAIGPDLRHVFMGAEGTLGVITEVTLKIFPLPEHRIFEAVNFTDVESGLSAMRRIAQAGLRPFLVRFYDESETRYAMRGAAADCVMFLGFEGIQMVTEAEYRASIAICQSEGGHLLGPKPVEAWYEHRFDFSAVENVLTRQGGVAETIEIAHFWSEILGTYHALRTALAPLTAEQLGHFSHVYPQGTSLYLILFGQVEDDAVAERRLLEIWDVAMHTCLKTGAAISHHHGIGLARREYLRDQLATSSLVLERIRGALDPARVMNPGKQLSD